MSVSREQLELAGKKAILSGQATKAVEQAGQGLAAVYGQCRADTAGLQTVESLMHVQGYITDAVRALLERERPPEIKIAR